MSRAVVVAAVLTPTLASASLAQRRTQALTSLTAPPTTTPATKAAIVPEKQQPAAAMTGPDWSLFGGVASGDNPYDIGIALGGAGKWHRSDWPVAVRGDAYFAHHSGDFGSDFGGVDLSINIFGVMGAAEYEFETTSKLKPYAFGGLGIFYSNVNVDYDGVFEDSAYDSSTDLGFGVGGGIHITPKFGVELRFMDIGGFNTIPILAVLHF
jgi:opacity protein-like surface antigen